MCKNELRWIDDKFDKNKLLSWQMNLPDKFSDNDVICHNCLKVLDESSFCTICKKSITHKNKPKREWDVEGPLCLDCYMNEMQKNYKSKEIQTSKGTTGKSTKMIRYQYYSAIFSLIMGPVLIISGLTTGSDLVWIVGIIVLVTAIIRYPKEKKQMDRISKTENDPLTFLKMRLVKGEITTEEFEELRKKIE